MGCLCGYLSGARCRLFACGPADATAIPKPHHLFDYKSRLVLPQSFQVFENGWIWKLRTAAAASSRVCFWGLHTCGCLSVYIGKTSDVRHLRSQSPHLPRHPRQSDEAAELEAAELDSVCYRRMSFIGRCWIASRSSHRPCSLVSLGLVMWSQFHQSGQL